MMNCSSSKLHQYDSQNHIPNMNINDQIVVDGTLNETHVNGGDTSGMEVLTFDDYGRPVELSKNKSVSDDSHNELKFDDYERQVTNHSIDTNIAHQRVHDKSCALKFDDYGRHITNHGNDTDIDHQSGHDNSCALKLTNKCKACSTYFGVFVRRHHCRNCGDIFCDKCTQGRTALSAEKHADEVRVCDQCLAEVTHWLSQVTEVSGFNRHEILAKKLQDEMEKRKEAAELKSNVADARMKEVECPTCTLVLQVEIPAIGSKTIECSLCLNPFIVSAR